MVTTYQMASPMYLLRNSVPWIAVLVPPSLLLAIFSGHGFLSVSITSLALLLITPMFLAFSKQKPAATMKKPVPEEEKEVADEGVMVEEKTDQGLDSGNESGDDDDDDHSSSFSEEEEEDSDADWLFSGNNSGHSPHCSSDCSISDEESLIELALPSGHFLGLEKPGPKLQLMNNNGPPVDLFADINEEDNMIEIDISMGSIKCSTFEIIEA